jgi:hypothetical protein
MKNLNPGQIIVGVSAGGHKGKPVYPRALEWLLQGQANGMGPSNLSTYLLAVDFKIE